MQMRNRRPPAVISHLPAGYRPEPQRDHVMSEGYIAPPKIFLFRNLSACPDILHFISTRIGGVSPPPFDSLNLGFKTADDPRNVLRSRERLSAALGIRLSRFVVPKQTHGTNIRIVGADHRGHGSMDYQSGLDDTDGLITNSPNVCLMVLVADCVPVLLYDPKRRVIGAIHAGWRGTAKLIARRAVEIMSSEFGSAPEDIVVGIGPSIGRCCYQVGSEVIHAFRANFECTDHIVERVGTDGRGFVDLWEANRSQLTDAGVRPGNIEVAAICTRCHASEYFSERATPGTGRFGAGIMLRDEDCARCTTIHCAGCNDP